MTERGPPRPVFLVTRNFPPLVGGMENLNLRMARALAAKRRFVLCGPRGSAEHAPSSIEIAEVPASPLWRFLFSSTVAALRLAWRHRPSVVIAGSGLTAPMILLAAAAIRARTLVYLHGLDIVAPSAVYRIAWLAAIRRCDAVLVNSRNTARLAVEAGVTAGKINVLHPGTDIPQEADAADIAAWRQQHDLGTHDVLLSVGRLTARKGLAEFVRDCLPHVIRQRPNAMLVVIGAEAVDALHGSRHNERERILQAARDAGVHAHVRFLGSCSDQDLSRAYFAADLHVFPVRAMPNDVEGFGMVALEAAAHGLSTVAYAVGGVPDAVVDGRTGRLIAPEDGRAFAAAVVELLATTRSANAPACIAFAEGKAWSKFAVRLEEIVHELDARH